MRPTVTRGPVVSYTAVSPLPVEDGRSVLCCAISQVTLGGRYPPSCSMEPGSSSADPNEDHGRGHQEVSSLQLYIRCGKGGIPPCGEAMTLPVTAWSITLNFLLFPKKERNILIWKPTPMNWKKKDVMLSATTVCSNFDRWYCLWQK